MPRISKSRLFSSKDFQIFLWRFCGISRGYKGSKPKVSPSKFFAVRAAQGASPDRRGVRFRANAISIIMFQSLPSGLDFRKRISAKSTAEGNAPEVWASPRERSRRLFFDSCPNQSEGRILMLSYSPSHSISCAIGCGVIDKELELLPCRRQRRVRCGS